MYIMEDMYRRINNQKVRELRGSRTRRAVLETINYGIGISELQSIENGTHKPSEQKLRLLLTALGCEYDDISDPVDLKTGAVVNEHI